MKKQNIYKGLSGCLILLLLLSGCSNTTKESTSKEEQKQVTEEKEESKSQKEEKQEETKEESETKDKYGNPDVRTGASYEYLEGELDLGSFKGHLLVQYSDLDLAYSKATPLEKELQIPLADEKQKEGNLQIEFVEQENGSSSFKWNAVENACEYIVFKATYEKEKGQSSERYTYQMLARTNELSWTYMAESKNAEFRTYEVSVDQWKNGSTKENYAEYFVSEDDPFIRNEHLYGVVAMMEDGSFVKSNYLDSTEISCKLPEKFSLNGEKIIDGSLVDKESDLPKTAKVIMADGHEEEREMIYDFDNAKEKIENFMNLNEEEEGNLGMQAIKTKEVHYQVKGTMLEGTIYLRVE